MTLADVTYAATIPVCALLSFAWAKFIESKESA